VDLKSSTVFSAIASPQPYVSQTAPVDGQDVAYRLMAPSLDVSLVISARKVLSNSIANGYGIQEIPVGALTIWALSENVLES
jgi:hypothetical protein